MSKNEVRTKKVRLGSGVLCDRIRQGERGKPDAHGIFSIFNCWALPSSRAGTVVFTAFNLPTGEYTFHVYFKRYRSSQEQHIASISVDNQGKEVADGGTTVFVPFAAHCKKPGRHQIIVRTMTGESELRIPVVIFVKPWPEFAPSDLEFIENNPSRIPAIQARVSCGNCQAPYLFVDAELQKSGLKAGAKILPDNGSFTCEICGNDIFTKDLQGQMRNSLLDFLQVAKRGG